MSHGFSRRELLKGAQGLALASPLLGLAGCQDLSDQRDLTAIKGAIMGTTYTVKVAAALDEKKRQELGKGIESALRDVDAKMSTYRTDSEISRLNQAPAGSWVTVSGDTLSVIEEAKRLGRMTSGAFDPTVGPLVNLWGFGPGDRTRSVPDDERIALARQEIGYRYVRLQQASPAVSKDRAKIHVDLSGIAKGFGVDKVAAYLEKAGIGDYLAEVGGDLRSAGKNTEKAAWRIGIEKPLGDPGRLQKIVHLSGQALATSGDYRIFFEREGKRYSHIVNPQTGRPVTHALASVTVIAPTAMEADAVSTALFVLGPQAGLELAKAQNLAAFFVSKEGKELRETWSPAFAKYMEA